MKLRPLTTQARISAAVTAAVVVLTLLLGLLLLTSSRRGANEALQHRARVAADAVLPPTQAAPAGVRRACAALRSERPPVPRDGEVQVAIGRSPHGTCRLARNRPHPLRERDPRRSTFNFPAGEQRIYVSVPRADVERVQRRTMVSWLAGALLVLVGSRVLADALARRSTRDLADTLAAVKRAVDDENLSTRVAPAPSPDMRTVAESVNGLIDRLARARTIQRLLVADAAHALRTPITSLRGNLDILLAGWRDTPPPDGREMVETATRQSHALARLVEDLVTLAQASAPTAAPAGTIRLDEVVVDRVAHWQQLLPSLAFVVDTRPAEVPGDADLVGRALDSAIDNAAKYGPADGPVLVVQRGALVEVHDDGPGPPDAPTSQLFHPYVRGSDVTGVTGSGLGLALVEAVAQLHGGHANLERSDRAAGTCCRMWFGPGAPLPREFQDSSKDDHRWLEHRGG